MIHYKELIRESFVHESNSTDHTVVIRLIQIVHLRLFVSLFDWFITRNLLESHLSISQTSLLTV